VDFPSQGNIEIGGEAQQGENLLLHRRQWGHMANDLLGQVYLVKVMGTKACRRRSAVGVAVALRGLSL
jgi:hypothetical protein